jgi:two-component sensor histidine kinase
MHAQLRDFLGPAAARAYLATLGAVLAAFAIRFAAQPVVGDNHPYSLFFPVVLLCAYAFGRGPAVLAAGLSAVLAYWTFVEPRFGIEVRLGSAAPLILFLVTAGVAIYLITGLTSALRALAADQGRLHAVANAHASLFHDLQSRIGHHMSLLMGVLTFQARGEPDPEVLVLLRKAGQRSELIARAVRERGGEPTSSVDFANFAQTLAGLVCAEAKQPATRITVSGGPVVTPIEVATTLGVALAECLAWILRHDPDGTIHVDVQTDGERARVWVGLTGSLGEPADVGAPAAFMFQAMVEQLGARLEVGAPGPSGPGLELTVPLPETPVVERPAVTLH